MISLIFWFKESMSGGCTTTIAKVWLQPGFCARVHASRLLDPRGLHISIDVGGKILLVKWGNSGIVQLDDGDDGAK